MVMFCGFADVEFEKSSGGLIRLYFLGQPATDRRESWVKNAKICNSHLPATNRFVTGDGFVYLECSPHLYHRTVYEPTRSPGDSAVRRA
jgi:hypothetical protein